jgi:CheY-like chemotaxis protein
MPNAREMACEMLRTFGFECFDAWNGEDALRILSGHPEIDVLFADVRMPGMSGTELADLARRMRPHLRVVLTSGWMGETPVRDLPFVPKPLRLGELRTVMERALAGRDKETT